MALTPLRLPRLQQGISITDSRTGRPSAAFVRYWNVELLTMIERSINGLAEVQAGLIEVQEEQAEQLVLIEAAQEQLAAQVLQIQSLLGIAQTAQQAANDAQTTADDALGAGTVSGSASNPAIDLPNDTTWVEGPIVPLTGVVAGNLTIVGTGPLQDEDVSVSVPGPTNCEFRVVEIDGVTETVMGTWAFQLREPFTGPNSADVVNTSAEAVAAFSAALTTTGALDYRVDARVTDLGTSVSNLSLYIYARRAA